MLMLVAGFVLPLLRSQLGLELAEALYLVASVLHDQSCNDDTALSCGSLPSHTACKHYELAPLFVMVAAAKLTQRLVLELAMPHIDHGSMLMLHTCLAAKH